MHNPHFALDIDIFVLDTELSPDENHDGWWYKVVFLRATCALRWLVVMVLLKLLRLLFRGACALLGSLLNTTAAAPLLYAHPPTLRDRAFPGSAHFLTHGRGCRCPHGARRAAIGAPARMLQPPSPSRELFPEFL